MGREQELQVSWPMSTAIPPGLENRSCEAHSPEKSNISEEVEETAQEASVGRTDDFMIASRAMHHAASDELGASGPYFWSQVARFCPDPVGSVSNEEGLGFCLACLRSRNFVMEEAMAVCRNFKDFRNRHGWPYYLISEALLTPLHHGVHWLLGRDNLHRRILIFNVGKIDVKLCCVEEYQKMGAHVMQQLIHEEDHILLNAESQP